jgi:hypothetical protein
MNYDITEVHVSTIQGGDTILYNDKITTVSFNNIKRDSFIGNTIFGDSFHSGNILVKKIIYKKFILN